MTLRRRHLLIAAVLVLVAATAGSVTWAAFTATTTNDAQVRAGTVILADNDSGGALLSLTDAVPGNADTSCIRIRYTGSLPASVRLYGTSGGTGLDQYLNVTVTRGVYTPSEPSFDSCTNFQADATNYIGAGAGIVYSGTLRDFPDDYASGIVDASSGSVETWTGTEDHVYRFQVTLQSDIAAEGLTGTQSFTWEARSL